MMKRTSRAIALSLLAFAVRAGADPVATLQRSSAERQGIPSDAILSFLEAAEAQVDALHSIMIVRHGKVVAEGWWTPYSKDAPHMLYSLSKSFTSTAVGMAVAEGKLSIDDPVLPFFPEDAPGEPSANLKAMRVRDLLAMSTGHHGDDLQKFSFDSQERLTKAFLALPVPHKPGTHFLYNTPATYMLSAIVQKVTGKTVLAYLGPRLFEPLGIKNPTWGTSREGVSLGGFGLKVTTEDIARFGQLYLQKGMWGDRRLLPAEWVDAATARQTSNGSSPTSDWDQGYGYQFWRCRHGLYRGDGAFGQYAIVMPEQDAVIAITSGTRDMQMVMNLVWEHLLPRMEKSPLPSDEIVTERLTRKLASLKLPAPAGKPTSPIAKDISGRRYVFPANDDKLESIALETAATGTTLVVRADGRDSRLAIGNGDWRRGGTLLADRADHPAAGNGGWTAADSFSAKVCGYESPYCLSFALRFSGDQVTVDREWNVVFGNQWKRPQLVGKGEPKPPRR